MKNVFTAVVLLMVSMVFSQEQTEKFNINKGTWMIEGRVNVNSNAQEFTESNANRDYFGFGISPKVGYLVSDNLVLGIGVGYIYGQGKSDGEKTSETNGITVTPYVKKFFPLSQKLAFHTQGEASYKHSKEKLVDAEFNELSIGVRPGLTYKLSEKFLLSANVGYLGYRNIESKFNGSNPVQEAKNSRFDLSLDSSNIQLGVAINL